jgi:hypothetical protein
VHPRFSLGSGDAQRQAVRRFADAAGLEWAVYDVVNPAAEAGIPVTFLCFERGVDRRRLAPIPEDWLSCGEAELRRYLGQARAVHRSFVSPDQVRDRKR